MINSKVVDFIQKMEAVRKGSAVKLFSEHKSPERIVRYINGPYSRIGIIHACSSQHTMGSMLYWRTFLKEYEELRSGA